MTETLPEDTQQQIFLALVSLQDEGVSVVDSRVRIAEQFGIDVDRVCGIEREGIRLKWAPLS